MWTQVFLGSLGLCIGGVIASGVVAFIITLGIVPRYAGITRTADKVRLYENCSMLGAFLGNIFFLYQGSFPLGKTGLFLVGTFFGIFLGSWIIALGEVVNIFSIMLRRTGITSGIGWIIGAMTLGKTIGSLIYFGKGWWL